MAGININEAIPLLECAKEGWPASNAEKYYVALELGIEALKRVKTARDAPAGLSFALLPGEILEEAAGYGCTGCGAIGEGAPNQLPPGWEKRERKDKTYYYLCPECIKAGIKPAEDYIVTDENREAAIDDIVGELTGEDTTEAEAKAIRDYANRMLDESGDWSKDDLEAAAASYSDGLQDAKKLFEGG